MVHTENTRVKIPALVHFTRLGYEYLSLKKNTSIDKETNIFIDVFVESINKINKSTISKESALKIIDELKIKLDNDDLGKAFYKLLLSGYEGIRFIDFSNPINNVFNIVTELPYKNGEDGFRPDITVLINGIPLAFVEVKKPNNKDGIQAEYSRMNIRSANKKFRRFMNITQLMVFSNNSEYDDNEITPLEGAFYATNNKGRLFFNHFREEQPEISSKIKPIDDSIENNILLDTNLSVIKNAPEYKTNLNKDSPTNRIITSVFSFERIFKIIKYSIAYVERTDAHGIKILEKQIMRYPQFFAIMAIEKSLKSNSKNGIIWHTQGSGKTALAYYAVKYLTDYYKNQNIIAKFYFIVDRLDLLIQSAGEFRVRGLYVDEVNSKEDFIQTIGSVSSKNMTGNDMITVVNIQKFSEESISKQADYNVNIQRIYFMDEAHRSYRPTGSFLANLMASDRNAVRIALTGTPLIGTVYDEKTGQVSKGRGYNSKDVFGDYIHKYYYNLSIVDGYTLRLVREGIQTRYRQKLQETLQEIETLQGSIKSKELYSHPKYVSALVEYITDDFKHSKLASGDSSIGGMIVCDSSEQARAIFEELKKTELSFALILHDEGDTDTRKEKTSNFKKGTIDLLIVYNMLLTGFSAPRLKKLYLGRVIKEHSLLQALTRVNRPYKKFRYGYVVDFADIRIEFDKTNKAYFDELQIELGDTFEQYSNIFKTSEEIKEDLNYVRDKLFMYDVSNAELFSQQISALDDKDELLTLRHALTLYTELYNLAKLHGYDDLSEHFTIEKATALYSDVNARIAMINSKNVLANVEDMSEILNLALDQIDFKFTKISESELVIADKFREILEKTRQVMASSQDTKDLEYISLFEELKRIFKKKNIEELAGDELTETIKQLERIKTDAEQKNLKDGMLSKKYEDDTKFMRTHKRLKEKETVFKSDLVLHQVLLHLKHEIDSQVLNNERLMENEPYFHRNMFPLVKKELESKNVPCTKQLIETISEYIANEYFSERKWAS